MAPLASLIPQICMQWKLGQQENNPFSPSIKQRPSFFFLAHIFALSCFIFALLLRPGNLILAMIMIAAFPSSPEGNDNDGGCKETLKRGMEKGVLGGGMELGSEIGVEEAKLAR